MYEHTKARLEVFNLRIDLLLKLSVIALIVLLVIFRATVLDMLADAGVKKLTLPFLEVEIPVAEAEEAKQRLAEILDQVAEQEQRNAALTELVRCASTNSCVETQAEEIAALTGVEAEIPATAQVVAQLQAAVLQTDRIIRTRGLSPDMPDSPWIIVVGADKSLSSAEYERDRLAAAGYDARIARKGSWLRTYAEFPTKEAATGAEQDIRALMGRQVSVLEFASWCPSPTDADGLTTCN